MLAANHNNTDVGKFIVFEGIDGCGKTTQQQLLHRYFVEQGKLAVITNEPTDNLIGRLIKKALINPGLLNLDNLFDRQMAYLFVSDRFYHLYNQDNGIIALTKQGFNVICSRYTLSSWAYNASSPEQEDLITCLNQNFPNPDLTLYLDLPVEESLNRTLSRNVSRGIVPEVYEQKAKLVEVRQNFERIFNDYEGNWQRIDATVDIESVHQQIITAVSQL